MINVYIGLPGSGKSTLAVKFARKYIKKGYKVFSNFPIAGCYLYDIDDVGIADISHCILILDEAGIDENNRNYKGMAKERIKYYKLIRHYHVEQFFIFSQAFDFDITLRRLADRMYIVEKGVFGNTTITRLNQRWDIDDEGNPTIKYKINRLYKLFHLWFPRSKYYKYFDSYSAPPLFPKDFEIIPEICDQKK